MKEGEQTVKLRGSNLLNQYANMTVFKSETSDGLAELIDAVQFPIFIKAMYWSPTDNKHIAFVLSKQKFENNSTKES